VPAVSSVEQGQNRSGVDQCAQCAVAAVPTLGIPANEMESALAPDEFINHIVEILNELGTWGGTPTSLYTTLKARTTPNPPLRPRALSANSNSRR